MANGGLPSNDLRQIVQEGRQPRLNMLLDDGILKVGFLLDVYTELGYEIKTVPALPVDLRAKWLLQHL